MLLRYKMRRRYYIVKRCWKVKKKYGYTVNSKCGQHVCFLLTQEDTDSTNEQVVAALSGVQSIQ